jgi:hypothetical protein
MLPRKNVKKWAKMQQAILSGYFEKSCRNLRAAPIRVIRNNNRFIYRLMRYFYVTARDKAPGDNFPPLPMGLK